MTLRQLPSVDRLVQSVETGLPRRLVIDVARSVVDDARRTLAEGGTVDPEADLRRLIHRLERTRPHIVLNATGVLLHTNLGRATLLPEAARVATEVAIGYANVELDLATGERGGRSGYLSRLLTTVTGAEAALVVNNNAAALYLALVAIASGGSVPVSRGELIEIGGSYRLPELMAASGCRLVEVGTTNRTRIEDYRRAVDESTRMLLKVHPSNYRVAGFSEDTPLGALVDLGNERGLPVVFDVGSGLIDDRTPWLSGAPPAWLAGEPGVAQSLTDGADLVTFSGDKLFGGPQAGIVVGSADLVGRLRRHPVARALRVDGPTLAALTVTAERYASGEAAELPFWRMATTGYEVLEERCRSVIALSGVDARVESVKSTAGAGSVPGSEVPSPAISIAADTEARFLALLAGDPPVLARRETGRLILDLRAVEPEDDSALAQALAVACRS